MSIIAVHDVEVDEAEYDTLDEAIAAALEQVGKGGVISIHEEDCELRGDDEDSCTCEPLTLTRGATA